MIFELQNEAEWHDFFPILPVQTMDNKVVWLETCLRKRVYIGFACDDMLGGSDYVWQYMQKGVL